MNRTPHEMTAAECAAAWGVKPSTWRSYVARGQAPQPFRKVGRTPLWAATEVMARRPAAAATIYERPEFTLYLDGYLDAVAEDTATAGKPSSEMDERMEAADRADVGWRAVHHVLDKLRDVCQQEEARTGEALAAIADDGFSASALETDARHTVWSALIRDLDRLALAANGESGVRHRLDAEIADL